LKSLPIIGTAATACAVVALSGCASWRIDKAAQVATGYASHLLCDDVFISGIDPDIAFNERVKPMPGMGLVNWGMKRQLDPARGEVSVSIIGLFKSRAQLRNGSGCISLPGGEWNITANTASGALSTTTNRESDSISTTNERLAAALTQAVTESGPPYHRTKALVVMHDGKVIAENYAAGYDANTPVLGFSMTKSVVNAFIGILVRQGRLSLDQPAPIDAWSDPSDPRHAITIEQLLRQTTGLALRQDNSGFDVTSQIMYSAVDKAGASAKAPLAVPPGTRWNYSDTNYMLLSRIVRDAVGGTANDVLQFANAELFAPLRMQHVTLDFDATGTPVGSSHMLASARDWARFGQLYLDDGIIDGRRILPEGWVHTSVTPTLATGYGAGFWTNRVPGLVAGWGVPWGLSTAPRDAFFARGFMGNFIVVLPSQRLVIVRLSVSHERGDDIEETNRVVGEILAALPSQ
jgi:CubicO group peptidase (beta-lactamase class C family)